MADDEVTVRLVGGPQDWAGKTLQAPRGQGGAYLISDCTPGRGEGEDIDPRAVYEPDDGPDADPAVWAFRGWVPSSPTDPPPENYERAAAAGPENGGWGRGVVL